MIGSMTRYGAMALLAGALISGAAPASAAHLACKPSIFALGRGPNLDIAMNHAVQNWRMKAAGAYGPAYSYWYNTVNRGRHCNGKGELIYCRVWASPCR